MAITPVVMQPGLLLAASESIIYLAPVDAPNGDALTGAQITTAAFTNTDTGAHKITVNIGRSSGSIGAANLAVDAQPLAPGQTWIAAQLAGQILGPGDSIQAFADTAGLVNAIISGFLVS
jgi:hypothetical protein